ncbi:hypothetical protein [Paenilisteria newyorkensis]|uniref:hypothetical protein n=1 Tax=Listeria newyorkensis TaxID=1497681 RepID=UPI000669D440|nr:hypothetical protein [Listeria newyorkensis]KMT62566.1 hypothetical protein X559_1104 [Listeria newyorkensis]
MSKLPYCVAFANGKVIEGQTNLTYEPGFARVTFIIADPTGGVIERLFYCEPQIEVKLKHANAERYSKIPGCSFEAMSVKVISIESNMDKLIEMVVEFKK